MPHTDFLVGQDERANQRNFAIKQDEKGPPKIRPPQADAGTSGGFGKLKRECQLVRVAQAILQLRRQRNEEFDSSLFGEPAWEMLLGLYVRDASGTACTLADLVATSNAPPSTAERWLAQLDRLGFVIRRSHPGEAKTEFVDLTVEAKAALERHLAAALKLVA